MTENLIIGEDSDGQPVRIDLSAIVASPDLMARLVWEGRSRNGKSSLLRQFRSQARRHLAEDRTVVVVDAKTWKSLAEDANDGDWLDPAAASRGGPFDLDKGYYEVEEA